MAQRVIGGKGGPSDMNHLEKKLKQVFKETSRICSVQYGYNPTRFLQMLENKGPVQTAIELVMAPRIHEGFIKLLELNRLDLTVEAIILRQPYCNLFPEEVLKKAKEKLKWGCK